jgi:predicted transcriptional regulator
MADTTFTFRVDEELKAAFSEVAAAQERTAAQLLRVLMREAVQRWHETQEHDAWFRGEVEQALARTMRTRQSGGAGTRRSRCSPPTTPCASRRSRPRRWWTCTPQRTRKHCAGAISCRPAAAAKPQACVRHRALLADDSTFDLEEPSSTPVPLADTTVALRERYLPRSDEVTRACRCWCGSRRSYPVSRACRRRSRRLTIQDHATSTSTAN